MTISPERMEINPHDEARMWEMFPKSPMQAAIHNFLVKELSELRLQVDKLPATDLSRLQAEIAASKRLLGFIHRKDSPPTK